LPPVAAVFVDPALQIESCEMGKHRASYNFSKLGVLCLPAPWQAGAFARDMGFADFIACIIPMSRNMFS
jgi:hypothetical protein